MRYVVTSLALAVLLPLAGGCARGGGKIKAGETTVMGVPNAGSPATLNTASDDETIPIPAGSEVVIVETEAVEARPATAEAPAVEARPASKETTIRFAGTTNWKRSRATVRADTGTVDTSVAKHGIDVAERRWLLWTAIACGIGGIVVKSMVPAWPSLSNGLLLAGALAGLSWKLADIPSWIWLVVLGVVTLLVLGYKRAEWDKDGDGRPDFLQKKDKPAPPSSS